MEAPTPLPGMEGITLQREVRESKLQLALRPPDTEEEQCPLLRGPEPPGLRREGSDLRAAAAHDVLGDGVDLVLHLHLLEPVVRHSHPKHAKVGPSEVQSQELSMFCRQEGPLLLRKRQAQTASQRPRLKTHQSCRKRSP